MRATLAALVVAAGLFASPLGEQLFCAVVTDAAGNVYLEDCWTESNAEVTP